MICGPNASGVLHRGQRLQWQVTRYQTYPIINPVTARSQFPHQHAYPSPPFPRLPRTSRTRESPPKALPRDGGRRAIPPMTAPEGGSRKPRTAPNERSPGGLNWDNRRRSTAAIELSPKPVRDKSPSHVRGRECWRPLSFVTFLASFLWACL